MNKEEQKQVIATLIGAYPNIFAKRSDHEDPKVKMGIWLSRLEQWDFDRTMKKLNKHIDENVFEPRIAEIKPYVSKVDTSWEQKLKEL